MVNRIRVSLTGFSGQPGVNTFYSTDLSAMRTALTNLYGALGGAGILPSTFQATIATDGDVINSATGAIEGSWTAPAILPSTTATPAGTVYASPAGLTLRWTTGTVADGSRIVGRTFIVPCASTMYESDGTLNPALLLTVQNAAANFVAAAAPGFVIWHRPRLARAAVGTLKALTAHPGSLAIVTGSSVRDKVAILRSRRD